MQKYPLPPNALQRFQNYRHQYPSQFWLLFWGMLVSTLGASMIWPYLIIYVSKQLGLPLTVAGSLITLNAAVGILSSFVAGPVTDKVGRKGPMAVSLACNGLAYLAMVPAHTFAAFAVIMALRGAFQPLYRVGADAMLADLIPAEKRADAYALSRLSKNVGIALGPALGGIMAATSYSIVFYIAAVTSIVFSLLITCFASETLPKSAREKKTIKPESWGGYAKIFQDRTFLVFILAFTLIQVSGSILWVLLAAYTKANYQIPESLFGLIPTTNALMVVFFQIYMTKRSNKFPPLWVMTLGGFFYAVGVGSIALGNGFWDFWMSMVLVTIGELMIVPTATTYTANLAPEDMRGRYMSMFALTWGLGTLIGPLMGGLLNDYINPASSWYGGGAAGLLGTLVFILLILKRNRDQVIRQGNRRWHLF